MLQLEGFNSAKIGVTHDNDMVVYDYDKCVNIFMQREGWTEEEAIEWMEYNVVCQKVTLFVIVQSKEFAIS